MQTIFRRPLAIMPSALSELRERLAGFSPAADARPRPQRRPLAQSSRPYKLLPLEVIDGRVALIHLAGVFLKDFPSNYPEDWGVVDTRKALRAVQAAAADPQILRIILRVDSPGGNVDGLAQLGDAIFEARASKRVIAQVDGLCASAAYYCASQAHEIRAGRTDETGSIGTILVIDDLSEMYAAQGIQTYVFATGQYKGAGVEGTVITEAQQAEFQRSVDDYFADFLAMIKRGRPRLAGSIGELADGRVWMTPDAISNGLIDSAMTIDTTLAIEASGAAADERAGPGRTRSAMAKLRTMRATDLDGEARTRTAQAKLRAMEAGGRR